MLVPEVAIVPVAARFVAPEPDMVPPDQLRLVVTVIVSEPVRVPPDMVRVVIG